MTTALDRYGLSFFTPSMLTMWRTEPAACIARYILKVRDDRGMEKMWRGKAVEAGLSTWLHRRDMSAALAVAEQEWMNASHGETSEAIEAQHAIIPAMVERAVDVLKDRPAPDATQHSIETWLDGVPAPVKGKADFLWSSIPPPLELKSTERMPAKPSADHAIQGAIYAEGRRQKTQANTAACEFLYITPKKAAIYILEGDDYEAALNDARQAASSLLALLDAAKSPADAFRMLPINRDCYLWSPGLFQSINERLANPDLIQAKRMLTLTEPLPFGKHRGATIADLAQREPGYLRWCLANDVLRLGEADRISLDSLLEEQGEAA